MSGIGVLLLRFIPCLSNFSGFKFGDPWFFTSKRMAPGCCRQMWTMDWSWWLVNLRPSTSKTISISLTLQAHPLIRMKKVTRWLSTFHLQSVVQRAPVTVALLTPALCGYPGTTCPEAALTLLHSVGELALHQQHPGSVGPLRRLAEALPASEEPQVMFQ